MTNEEIIALAREAGAGEPESLYGRTDYIVLTRHDLERFAALVEQATLEKAAKVIENECHDDMTRAEEAAAIRNMK